ncbi:F-box/LRR-repeat protein At4g29420-like [Lolium rigidum]|uniref:F-box/LRR-repeat protein At4g29420-like n=1 Tax=Lolium rigidum TaxID=89674 RepID=UPI001F5C5BD8|nr:F-box/LRR-repeat protein At4g29420-like [Lolium rigidum]
MSSEATGADTASQNYVEHAIRTFTSAAKSMMPNSSTPQAETFSSSSNVHSIINSVVEKHSTIWAEEFSSFVSSVNLIHHKRVSLMADDISDTISSLMGNHQTSVDASSSQFQDPLHPGGVTSAYQVPHPGVLKEKKASQPDQASVDLVLDQQNPPIASEGQVPEAGLNSEDAQESQVNENVSTECLVSRVEQQHTQRKHQWRQGTTTGTNHLTLETQTTNEQRHPQDGIVHVSPDPTEDQSPNFSRGICSIVGDDPSPRENTATPTPADANLIGGLRNRNSLTIPLCRPSSNPILKRRRSSLEDISMVHISEAGAPLNNLPPLILANILGRVADIRDIAACRLASRALLAAAYQCPRIRLDAATRTQCLQEDRGGDKGTAFWTLAGNVALHLGSHLRSLVVNASNEQGSVDDAMWVEEGNFDEADDLHVTSLKAVLAWASTPAGPTLQEVEIADFWRQSCWRKVEALPVISHLCHNLLKLGLKNAWLSVDGLKIMPNLTQLTLECIRIEDENLSKLNECFPCLQILNLVRVGKLKDPKICLSQLKTLRWEVSTNVRHSLAIHAPNLVYLELKCFRPEILILDAPSLSTLKLTIDKLSPTTQADGLVSLKNVWIESLDLDSLLQLFTYGRDIKSLDLELPYSADCRDLYDAVEPDYLVQLFARINEVKLSPRFSCELMRLLVACSDSLFPSCLEKLLVHLPASDTANCPFVPLLRNCAPFCKVTVLLHADTSDAARQAAASVWPLRFPEMTWQWGTWQ